jgi:hypothetical protein
MDRLGRATRSKGGIKPVANVPTSTGKLPLAVRQLQSAAFWNMKPSGCALPTLDVDSSSKEEVTQEPNVSSIPTEEEDDKKEIHSRFIGETESIRVLIHEAAVCGNCKKGKLEMTFETKCLATVLNTKCTICGAHSASTCSNTRIPQESHDRNTNYATNVLFVLAQLLSSDGGTEASRIVGMLDLPNASIGETAFASMEYELGKYIIPYSKELIRSNLVKEVGLYSQSNPKFDFEQWYLNHNEKPELVVIEELPLLTEGYDMGWQKRLSGHRYDSHSGHAIPVGVLMNLPIGLAVLNRFC